MSEIQQNQDQDQVQDQVQDQTNKQAPPTPVAYSSLLAKLREQQKQKLSSEQVESESKPESDIKSGSQAQKTQKRGFGKNQKTTTPKRSTRQTKSQDQTEGQTQTNSELKQRPRSNFKPKFQQNQTPRLSPEEYMEELKKCQNTFFKYLGEYLREEVVMKPKQEDTKKDSGKKDAKQAKPVKKTNLQRIQDGQSVNILRAIKEKEQNSDLKYLDNLVTNRQIDFVKNLAEQMSRACVCTNFKGKYTIMLHSPYLMV